MRTSSLQGGLLTADDQTTHSITLDTEGHLLVDEQRAHLVVETSAHVTLVLPTMMIRCTTGAFWSAFVGAEAVPTPEEAGYWFAQTLLRQEQLTDWKTHVEAVMHQMTEMLAPALPQMTLPQPRLDAFTEACLARCSVHPTVAQVQALATLLQQDTETVSRWLEERGKGVVMAFSALKRAEAATAPMTSREQEDHEQKQEERPEAPVAEASEQCASATRMAPTRAVSVRTKPGQFKWTEERITQLRTAFMALPASAQHSRYGAATIIARQQNWPRQSVEYKLYALFPRPLEEAEPGVEVLATGAFLWDVQVTREGEPARHERWELNYPLGEFPYATQSVVKYRGRKYEVQQAHVNILVMRLLQQHLETGETGNVPEEMQPARHDLLEAIGA